MSQDPRSQWEQELRDRQTHNYVFPGTMINSTAAVRKLVEKPLRGKIQKLGFVLWLCPAYALFVGIVIAFYRWTQEPEFSWRDAAGDAIVGIGVLLGIGAAIILLLAIPYTIHRVQNYKEQLRTEKRREQRQIQIGRRRSRAKSN